MRTTQAAKRDRTMLATLQQYVTVSSDDIKHLVNAQFNELFLATDAIREALDEGPHKRIPNPHFRLLWRRYVRSNEVKWDDFFHFLGEYLKTQFGLSVEEVAGELSPRNKLRIKKRLDSFPSDATVCASA